jgi:hypothetical protein
MHPAFVSLQMANDPERDLLPVKDGVLCERQRNVSTFSLNTERGNHYKTIIHLCVNLDIYTTEFKVTSSCPCD